MEWPGLKINRLWDSQVHETMLKESIYQNCIDNFYKISHVKKMYWLNMLPLRGYFACGTAADQRKK